MIYSPGDIVKAKFTNMEGASAEALFIVIYNEAIDSSVPHNRNLVVAKLTTNYDFYDCYSHGLDAKIYPFLDKRCYVRSNKINIIDNVGVNQYLGSLTDADRMRVVSKFSKFTKEVTRQNKINKI